MDYAVGLIYSLASLGIPAYGLYRIAQLQALGISKRKIYLQMITLHVTLSIVGFGVFFWLMRDRASGQFIQAILLIGFIQLLANTVSADWYLQGRARFDIPAIRNLCLRTMGLFAIFWIVLSPSDYVMYYWIIAISVCLAAGINAAWIIHDLKKEEAIESTTSIQWKELMLFFVGTVFVSSTDYLDATMLGLIRSEGEVGYYSNAAKLIRLSLVVPMALNLVISPQLSGHFALKDSQRSREILNQAVSWIIYLSLPICTLYLLYADQLIQLFAGDQFNPSIPLMRWMAGIPLFISLSNLFIYYGLFGLDRALKYRMVLGVVAGIFISILLNLWLIPLYGATGAAINSFIIELGFMVLFALWIKPIFKWTAHLKSLITCLLFLPVYFMIMQAPWNVLSKLMIGGISSVLIYLLMQHYVWKHPMPILYSSNFNTARNAS